jgi:hypothetical protein
VYRPTFADEFRGAVAVTIGDARSRFAQDEAECDAWAGHAQFTNGLHTVTSLPLRPASMTASLCWQRPLVAHTVPRGSPSYN